MEVYRKRLRQQHACMISKYLQIRRLEQVYVVASQTSKFLLHFRRAILQTPANGHVGFSNSKKNLCDWVAELIPTQVFKMDLFAFSYQG